MIQSNGLSYSFNKNVVTLIEVITNYNNPHYKYEEFYFFKNNIRFLDKELNLDIWQQFILFC